MQPRKHGRDHCPKGTDPSLPLPDSDGLVLTSELDATCGVSWQSPGAASSTPIEWIVVQSTTSWEATGTTLDWTELRGNYTGDTFGISADDNLTIGKGGAYVLHTDFHGVPVDPGVPYSHIRFGYARVAGPAITGGTHTWVLNNSFPVIKTHIVAGDPLSPQGNSLNFFHDFIDVDMEGDFTPPLEIEMEGTIYWDGLAVDANPFLVRVVVYRLGDTPT